MDSFSFLGEINNIPSFFEADVQARAPSRQDPRGTRNQIVRRKRTKEMRLQGPNSLGSKEVSYDGQSIGSEQWPANAEDSLRLQTTEATLQKEDGGEKEINNLLQSSKSNVEKDSPPTYPVLLTYNDAPSYLKFNPYIKTGYRGCLSTKMCLESIFWWTNETINIWSHIFGWMLFLGLSFYDLVLLNIHAPVLDKLIVGLLLACFQACMILSSLYHTFSCRSEKDYVCFLSFDLFGIALSLLAIYMSGVYYAFWCYPEWQQFYLITVCLIFAVAMALQIPRFNVSANVKLMVFVGWAAYGVLPTIHWTIMMGGWENPIVELLLPRVLGMYAISGLAFFIYLSKIPERWFAGKVDYLGSSHQWWHFFVVVALYYWHNTAMISLPHLRELHGALNAEKLAAIERM